VVLIQVAVPSRGDVEEYQNLRTTVNELVGRINGQFGSVEFVPIHFMHQSVDFTELVALYNISDVCLVSSTRDGMNLVLTLPANKTFSLSFFYFLFFIFFLSRFRSLWPNLQVSYEYICTQQERHGVMILSEFAGAAQSLNGSIIVNPWNTEELAQAIEDAITMSDEQRAISHVKLYKYVTRYTSQYWGFPPLQIFSLSFLFFYFIF